MIKRELAVILFVQRTLMATLDVINAPSVKRILLSPRCAVRCVSCALAVQAGKAPLALNFAIALARPFFRLLLRSIGEFLLGLLRLIVLQ